jgi:molybdopterin/thiamine biosynthesis adenylyltransferase/molybdopterin synthase catalytic subunit/rhodanese-related sulfurtransferase
MTLFRFSTEPIDAALLRAGLESAAAGGYSSFEGWVRDHNEGRRVRRLEYEAFEALALKEGERIVSEAVARFGVERAACVHRLGALEIGETAVWVGVAAPHRHEAFLACRYIIDAVKHRVPIWKKEHYLDGDSGWVNCERCAAPAEPLAEAGARAADDRHRHAPDHPSAPLSATQIAPAPDYSRQMVLPEVGAAGQALLGRASVLIVGCGGLGVPAMSYLAASGIGRLGLVDADVLEASNLHRQPIYALEDAGRPKVDLAAERLRTVNPALDVRTYRTRLDPGNAPELIAGYDIVIDCTDSIASKLALNDACVRSGQPAVFASVYQYEGQLQVVRPGQGPCLRCIWPEAARDGLLGACAEAGVLGPVPGVLGTLQALEALKVLLGLPGQLTDAVLMVDLLTLNVTRLRARRAPDCPRHAARGAGTVLSADAPGVEIEFDSLPAALAAGYILIDVREPAECAREPAPGVAVSAIPLAQLLYGPPPASLSQRCLLICASGVRSLAAARELRARGHAHVFSLRGGLTSLVRAATA